ncbi:MAG: hypothetical protein H6Q94_317 [Nitrospirae bacterium]|nr:hypothetical protein [Nitrospirota bacterium]
MEYEIAIRESIPEKILSVLLMVTINGVIITEVKQKRNRISPDIAERPAFLKRMDFHATTAYASRFTFAKDFSQPGKFARMLFAIFFNKEIRKSIFLLLPLTLIRAILIYIPCYKQ